MSRTCRRRMAAFYPAAIFAVLAVICLFLAAPGIGGVKADPETGDEAFIVLDSHTGSRWGQISLLDVFSNAAFGGASVIAPESSGEYAFTVQNTARFPMKITMKISDENAAGVPMRYRLLQDGEYIAGSESEWLDISALSEIVSELPVRSEKEYLLEWLWQGGDNAADTAAGIAAQNGAAYVLDFTINSEQSGEAIGPEQPPQTGDHTANTALWTALAVSFLILSLTLFFLKRRASEDENA